MQIVPLRLLTPHETIEFTLNLVKNTNPNDPHNKKCREKLVVELTFKPFIDDSVRFSGSLHGSGKSEDMVGKGSEDVSLNRAAGLLLVLLQGAEDVEGNHHNSPYAVVNFGGEQKKTKTIKKTRDLCWKLERRVPICARRGSSKGEDPY
ncbi:synaptotagmin-3-like [Quercus robur]|uniref:synaptotagmin-3-like n=1 Tax=Quercus robur TaxID=38942 RepID=UPI0021633B19|nr:synaptotagmin-3-like [Quercus robur]XP_050262857.1 synaptotagmin-3-like [Quercus robur]XP_050262858.1 synaptotagmin-3-like [Quercus robur]